VADLSVTRARRVVVAEPAFRAPRRLDLATT
jgi:hypothetical protein